MKTAHVTAALFAVAALAATAAIANSHADPRKAPAYVVSEIDVTDPVTFKTYAERQGALIKQFGGRFLARGGKVEAITGEALRQRTVIYVFDSMEKVEAWHHAPEQKELAALRDKSSNYRSFAVEGCSDCKPPSGR